MQGFIPAPGSSSVPPNPFGIELILCSSSGVLMISTRPVQGGQEVTARVAGMFDDVCATQPERPDFASRYGRETMPTLTNPPGTGDGMGRDCTFWNSSGGAGSTRLATQMSPEQLLEHYGKQLADSGWASGSGDQMAARSWTRRDSSGAVTEITLIARRRAEAPNCAEMEMRYNSRRNR